MLRRILMSFSAIACGLAFSNSPAPIGAAPQPKKSEAKDDAPSLDLTINGSLAQGDPKDRKLNQPCKEHAMKLPKGKTVQIDLVSTDFDAYLRIEDSNGNELAVDDDSGGNLNSRIIFGIPKDDTYKIFATTLNGNLGNYQLTVKPVAATKLKAPAAGKSLDTNDKLSNVEPSKFYEIEFDANDYQIDMVSTDFDTYLHVYDANGKELAKDDDSGGNLNARIVFSPPAAGTYRILARSFDGNFGAFTLTIENKK